MGKNDADRPFAGRQLTRRERRVADRRARERASIRAKAMPPPEVSDRTDPVTGRPMYVADGAHDPRRPGGAPLPDPADGPRALPAPVAPHATAPRLPAPTSPGQLPQQAPGQLPSPGQQRPPAHPANRPASGQPLQLPAATSSEEGKTSRLRRAPKPVPSLAEQAARQQKKAARRDRATGAVAGAAAPRWLLAGLLVLVVVATVVATQIVTGAAFDPYLASGSVVGVLLGVYATRRGWPGTALKVKVPALGVAGLVLAAAVIGTVADPVVIDGQVLSETSKEAQSVRLAEDLSRDLRAMAEYDNLLVADISDARAQVSDYEPAKQRLLEMSQKWGEYDDVPDPAFAPVIEHVKTASFWQSEAMATKQMLIEEADSQAEANLETQRASFVESWFAATEGLNEVGTALGIPVSDTEGPHE